MRTLEKTFYGTDSDGNELYLITAVGTSNDTKPTTGVVTGSKFIEWNTTDEKLYVYMYFEELNDWKKV